MPLFDFQCQNANCGHVFEMIARVGTKVADCPECQSEAKRVMSCSSVIKFFFNYMEP